MAEYLISELEVPEVGKTLIFKDKEARNDLSTAVVETSPSNPLTFTTRSAQKAQSAEIVLEPIQDLHGYDHPWPAGGGKNKLPMTVDGIKAANTDGTWTGNVYALNGLTFTILTDDGNNLTGILINGNSTSVTILYLNPSFLLKSDLYILNGTPASGGVETWRLQVNLGQQFNIDSGNGNSFTVSEDFPNSLSFIRVGSGMNLQNVLFQPMIRLATETDPTFAPYSNICPIDGRTETSLVGCGFNIWDEEWEVGGIDDSTGEKITAQTQIRSKNYVLVIPNIQYYVKANDSTYVYFYDLSKKFISRAYYGAYDIKNTKITIPNECYYILFKQQKTASTAIYNHDICINISDTVKNGTYEPYILSNNLTIQFGEKVYGATFTMETGELVVTWGMVDLGDLEWTYRGSDYPDIFSCALSQNFYQLSDDIKVMCSYYPYVGTVVSINAMTNKKDKSISLYFSQTSVSRLIYIKDSSFAGDATALKTALSGQQLVYELATPITYHLTPDEIKLLSGVNTIWTDGTSIKVAYRDGKVATLADLQEISDSPFKIVNGALCWISNK